ncbi:MAG: FtsW/RodA/SpoVE family cell cycle protein, partial [Clostridia bacterium]
MIIKAIKRDYMLILAVFMLVTIGLIFIYSASNYTAKETYNNSYYFVIKQAIGAVIGLILMLIMIKISLEKVKKYSFILLIISYILLILVFVPGIGIENYGAKRWIG